MPHTSLSSIKPTCFLLYKNAKVKVRSPDYSNYSDIVAGVLQGDSLVPSLFIICLVYVLKTSIDRMKEKWSQANKGKKQKVLCTSNNGHGLRQWQYFWQMNPPKPKPCYIVWNEELMAQTYNVNAHTTEYMCFYQTGNISTLNGSSLKIVTSSPTKEEVSHQPRQRSTRHYQMHDQVSVDW